MDEITESLDHLEKEKITVDIGWANIFSIIILIPITLIYGLPYYLIWANELFFKNFSFHKTVGSSFIFLLVLIIGIVAHELIHGIVFALFAKRGFKSIKFGVMWKMLTPYCHCNEPLKVRQYIIGALMPAIVLGLIPAVFAIVMGNISLLIFGIFFTMAGAGDFLVSYALRKEKGDTLVEDHPSEAGCYVYRPIQKTEKN